MWKFTKVFREAKKVLGNQVENGSHRPRKPVKRLENSSEGSRKHARTERLLRRVLRRLK